MATLGIAVHTLKDWAKTRDPDGMSADIVELLSQENEILEDQMYMEGNLPTGNVTTVRTGLPSTTWRKLNEGVAPSKSTSAQITDQASILESWSEVDAKIAELNGDIAAYRMGESSAHLQSMGIEQASTLWYGNGGTSPEEYDGFAVRYNSLTANNGTNILDAAGTGSDNCSVWLIGWGANTVHGIFPKGGTAGLIREDLGKKMIQTGTGIGAGKLMAYVERFEWTSGLAVKDWRYACRIANIDASDLSGVSSAADLSEFMARATYRIPGSGIKVTGGGRTVNQVFYMNRTCRQMLDILNRNDVITGGGLTFDNVDGERVEFFRGIKVKLTDSLTVAEAQIT